MEISTVSTPGMTTGGIKILWSEHRNDVYQHALSLSQTMSGIEIISRIKSTASGADDIQIAGIPNPKVYAYQDLDDITKEQPVGHSIMIDFSDQSVFDQVLDLAVRTHVPLMSGTIGLSWEQQRALHRAAKEIPIFYDVNCYFRIKQFTDRAVERIKTQPKSSHTLIEHYYDNDVDFANGLALSITDKILQETNKNLGSLVRYNLVGMNAGACELKLMPDDEILKTSELDESEESDRVECCTQGYAELAQNVLEIVKVMASPSLEKGKVYDLDSLWGLLPDAAKQTTST